MRLIIATVFVITSCWVSDSANAQRELQKIKNDYRDGRPFQYQPSDPFVRSKLFKTHIGHGGKFYNCDGQECKRDSPYICWKTHHEYDLPPKKKFLDLLNCEIEQVQQRIRDGAGPCMQDNCSCSECQQTVGHPQHSQAVCELAGDDSKQNWGKQKQIEQQRIAQNRQSAPSSKRSHAQTSRVSNVMRITSADDREEGFGLLQGKIVTQRDSSNQQVVTKANVRTRSNYQPKSSQAKDVSLFQRLVDQKQKQAGASIGVASPSQIRTANSSIMSAFRPSKK